MNNHNLKLENEKVFSIPDLHDYCRGRPSTVWQEKGSDSQRFTAVAKPVVDSGKAKADSLKYAKQYDSLNVLLVSQEKFYSYISEKFFPEKYKNTEIEKAIALADSLSAARDSENGHYE